MKDAVEILREHLITSGNGLYTLNAGRVWFQDLPDGFTNTQSAIVLTVANESSEMNGAMIKLTVNMRVYGGTNQKLTTRTLYRALVDRLHNQHGSNADGSIIRARVVQGIMSADPATDWPVMIVTANVTIEGY